MELPHTKIKFSPYLNIISREVWFLVRKWLLEFCEFYYLIINSLILTSKIQQTVIVTFTPYYEWTTMSLPRFLSESAHTVFKEQYILMRATLLLSLPYPCKTTITFCVWKHSSLGLIVSDPTLLPLWCPSKHSLANYIVGQRQTILWIFSYPHLYMQSANRIIFSALGFIGYAQTQPLML